MASYASSVATDRGVRLNATADPSAIMHAMTLFVQCEFRVLQPGNEPTLERIARAVAAATADEPGTLRYQWFVAQRPGHYTILEEYTNADAAEAHNQHVHAFLVEFFAVAELVSISFYGELNQYLRDWITGRAGVAVNVPL
jgi:quinol monooxygenase YgiN